jgi:hypothetical protein
MCTADTMGGSIRMTFGKLGGRFECLMTSEEVDRDTPSAQQIKKRKATSDYLENPMVIVKKETLDKINSFGNIKKEKDDALVNIDDLLEDSEDEVEKKPNVKELFNTVKPGIRMTINTARKCVDVYSEISPESLKKDAKTVLARDIPPLPDDLEIQVIDDVKDDDDGDFKKSGVNEHKCVNSGCSKTNSHICVYPPYRKLSASHLKTKGIFNLEKHLKNKKSFKIFNKSFPGCIFYLKAHHGSHIEVLGVGSRHHRFKITLYQGNTSTTSPGRVGQTHSLALPTTSFKGGIIKYKIVMYISH